MIRPQDMGHRAPAVWWLPDPGRQRCTRTGNSRDRCPRWLSFPLVVAFGAFGGSACSLSEDCDPEAVDAFQSLPAYEGAAIELHGSPGIGCTDTVEAVDRDAFVDHYEEEMRQAGWEVLTDSSGVFGKGPHGGVRIDRLEGNEVGVYVLSPDEYS